MVEPSGQLNKNKTFGTNLSEYYSKNLDKSTTSSFVTQLKVNVRGIRNSVFVIHNKGVVDLDFEILVTAEEVDSIVDPTGTNDDDKGWVSLATGSIASGGIPSIQTLTDSYTRVLIRIKHTTATTTVNLWHRGEN